MFSYIKESQKLGDEVFLDMNDILEVSDILKDSGETGHMTRKMHVKNFLLI
jgi:hypothetical protein